jgi:hypothetical protein
MYVTSLNSPRADDRPALQELFRQALKTGWNGTETPLKLAPSQLIICAMRLANL